MSAHFEVLKSIFSSASPDLQSRMLWSFTAMLDAGGVDFSGIEPEADDDILTALNKQEARRAVWTQAGPRQPASWERFERLFRKHTDAGLSDAFLTTALLDVMEQTTSFLASGNIHDAYAKNDRFRAFISLKMSEAPLDDRDRFERMIELNDSLRKDIEKNIALNIALYSEWQLIAGERLRAERVEGGWIDLSEAALRSSSFLSDHGFGPAED